MNVTGPLPFVPASAADTPPASYVYQARRNLKPGRYRMAVIVEDKIIPGQSGSLVQAIDIPDFSSGSFGMSSISLLARFGPIEAGIGPDDHPPAGYGDSARSFPFPASISCPPHDATVPPMRCSRSDSTMRLKGKGLRTRIS